MKPINVVTVLVIIGTYASIYLDASSVKLPHLSGLSLLDAVLVCFVSVFTLQAAITPKVLDLEEQFSFYSSYHDHAVNKLIHLCLIWPILWTGLVLFTDTTALPLPTLPTPLPATLPWGPPVLTGGFALYVTCLDPKSGPVSALLAILCLVTSQLFAAQMGDRAVPVAGALHACSWLGQFVGHGLFERRAPSLLNNLAQSFLMAPHFVFLEACFWLGCRRDLYVRTRPKILNRIKELNAAYAR
eukprot:EG_transcript_18423